MPRKAKKVEEPPAEEQVSSAVAVATAEVEPEIAGTDGSTVPTVVTRAVTFQLGGQLYGLPIDVVQEIQQLVEYTPLPNTAPALIGLIDLRGMVVPAIDLRLLVGMEAAPYTLQTPMIFCRVRGHVVCLIVDDVEDVVDLPETGLQTPSGLYGLADRMIGMCRLPQGLLLVLDIERLVPDATLAVAEASGGARL